MGISIIVSDFERFHVITGGPGSGKSTLIEALARRSYAHSIEAGRAIIQDQIAIGRPALPRRDPLAFAELMLSWELHSHRRAQRETGHVFFDRGVPDMVGYFHRLGQPVPPHVTRAAERFRYNRRVFLAPYWPEIFRQDAERDQAAEEASRICEAMVQAYSDCGYELVTLPLVSVGERVRFVLADISA